MLFRVFRPVVGIKNNKEKIWCRKQTRTLFCSPILVHLFSVSQIKGFTSRVHAISSVLTNTTNMCQNNFVFAPNYATLVSARSLHTQCTRRTNKILKHKFFMHTVSLLNLLVCQQAMLGLQQHRLLLQFQCKASSRIIDTCINTRAKLICATNVALEGAFLPIPTKTGNKRVASGGQFVHLNISSWCIAIYYIVLKLDNKVKTYNSVLCKHMTYCMHTGRKNIDVWNWKQVDNNWWEEQSLGLFSVWYFFFIIFFHQPQAWKRG